jgi:hypothetical protein
MKEGFEPKSFKNYNLTLEEQKRIGQIPGQNFGKRVYLTVPIASIITFLLCQKERWKASTMSRLSVPEQLDS